MAESYHDLEAVVEQPDDQFKTTLPSVIDDVEENLETVLVEQPSTYEQLSTRMSTLDAIDEYAAQHTQTVETFIDVLWGGMELISRSAPEVQAQVDAKFTANWDPDDAPVGWHMTTDPDTGIVSGGAGLLEDPELTFSGPTEVLFRMLGDEEFNAATAFLRNTFEISGPLGTARSLGKTMETVVEHAHEIESEDVQ
jgi:hypothetical protein